MGGRAFSGATFSCRLSVSSAQGRLLHCQAVRPEIDRPRVCSENHQHKETHVARYGTEDSGDTWQTDGRLTELPDSLCRLSKAGTGGQDLPKATALEHSAPA